MKHTLLLLLCAASLLSCSSNLKKENEALRSEIAERREALVQKQQDELQKARQAMAEADSLLAAATKEHDELHEWVMAHAQQLNDRSPEVQRLNRLRARVDSLHEAFETQAHKVKYILHKTQPQH